ncbi:porin family protein [Maribacter cobaltidurans]|uniref:Outer membrane protein beta-barrel domain-containing protein n=1 Tax=Maribacter cobaltidurans TaxID=1178778 RepID=A0A223V3G4_9FLAO|nr:porin family protein [Maribacter cobaltidurans]ASV29528.1 hypothetical protein CJ263_04430 [Maribacter cobaltidurans]GGD68272.1 hypothetical protein GCM10011412_02300 [Maribacter cobaltidurans]
MRLFIFLLFLSCYFSCLSQDSSSNEVSDNQRYFEDQFYLGITYNFIRKRPDDLNQRNLSYGLQGGIIKDIPLNKGGTRALAVGLGLALNTYYSNLVVRELSNGFSYDIGGLVGGFKRSKIETHLIEFPLEFRWRNSTPSDYKFWRIYAGVKFGYVVGARSKLVTSDYKDGFFNSDVNRFQYGPTFNVGYNTFNVHIYYSLTDLFSDKALLNNESIGLKALRVGLIFYIL